MKVQFQIQTGEHAGQWRTIRAGVSQVLAERIKARAESEHPGCTIRIVNDET